MSKRRLEKESLLNSPIIAEEIKRGLEAALSRVWVFSHKQEGNNRSSSKTDMLHEGFERSVLRAFGDHRGKFEENFKLKAEKESARTERTERISEIIDINGQEFKVDLLLSEKETPQTVFLLKAPLMSINKNRQNSFGSMTGEIHRFFGNPLNDGVGLVFVNFVPSSTFMKSGNDKLKEESVQWMSLNDETNGKTLLERLRLVPSVQARVSEVKIGYDLALGTGLGEIKTLAELREILKTQTGQSIVRLQEGALEGLRAYVGQFMAQRPEIFGPVEACVGTVAEQDAPEAAKDAVCLGAELVVETPVKKPRSGM